MNKIFSQKVSRAFEIADYFLLLPASYGLLMAALTLSFTLWIFVPVALIYAAGCALLYGFIKHSRGKLSRKASVWLWSGTMVYNLFHALFWIAVSANARETQDAVMFAGFSSWGLTIFALSSLALRKDLDKLEDDSD